MRFRINLQAVDPGKRVLPVNYQYPLSAWIYKTISHGNHEFARFLHERGFDAGNRSYKLFTFAWFKFAENVLRYFGFRVYQKLNKCSLIISFDSPSGDSFFSDE